MKRLGVLALMFVLIGLASAAPSISGINGELDDGKRVSVVGSDFGSMGGEIVSWDDFEAHAVGVDLESRTLDPIVGPTWSTFKLAPSLDPVEISSTRSNSGSKSVMIDWDEEGINSFGWAGQGPFDKLYISYWRYMHGDYSPDISVCHTGEYACNHKQFYLFGNRDTKPQGMPLIPAGTTTWGYYNNVGDTEAHCGAGYKLKNNLNDAGWTYDNTADEFQRWEWWIELNTPYTECNGVVKGWVDGVLGIENYNYRHRNVDGEYRDFRLGHMAGGFAESAIAWFDDLYIATTQARVEVCEGSSWNSRGQCQVQAPISWSGSQISFDFNAGSLSSGQSAYLYVVDSDGAASSSYSISVGEGFSVDCSGDSDGDFYGTGSGCLGTDCDDSDSSIHDLRSCTDYSDCSSVEVCGVCESAPIEVCNEVDDDCDGVVDEGCGSGDGDQTPVESDVSGAIVEDTFLRSNDNSNYGSNEDLRTHTWPTNTISNVILMKIDLDAIENLDRAESVELGMYLIDAGGDDSYEIGVHRIEGVDPVLSLVNSGSYDGTNSWDEDLGLGNIADATNVSVDSELGWKYFDISEIVSYWKDNPSENFGLLISADDDASSDSWRYFASLESSDEERRPYLRVGYGSQIKGDLDGDGVISFGEVEGYVLRWVGGEVSISDLLEVMNGWKGL